MLTAILSLLSLVMVGAVVRNCRFERQSVESTETAPGTLSSYAGQIWVSLGLSAVAIGDPVAWRSDQVVEVEKTTASDAVADAATVNVDLATGKYVSSGGTAVGKARGASAAGVTTVRIALNEN